MNPDTAAVLDQARTTLVKAKGEHVAGLMWDAMEKKYEYEHESVWCAAVLDMMKGMGISLDASKAQATTEDHVEANRMLAARSPATETTGEKKATNEPTDLNTQRRRRVWGRRRYANERARSKARLNRDIYLEGGGWYPMPRIVSQEVRSAMSRNVLLAYVFVCEIADPNDGRFDVSFEEIAYALGNRVRSAGITALTLLLDAGLIAREKSGRKGVATSYRLAAVRDIDQTKAAQVFLRARTRATEAGERAQKRAKEIAAEKAAKAS